MRYEFQILSLVSDDWWNVFEKPACRNIALFMYLFHIQLTLLNCISFRLASSHIPRVINVCRCLAALGVLFQHKQKEVTSLESDKEAGAPPQWRGGVCPVQPLFSISGNAAARMDITFTDP